jgi:hypothetical protein
MQRERIFELIKEANLVRIRTCCQGVPNKLCATDVWTGNLDAFVALIEREVTEACIQQTANASANDPEVQQRVRNEIANTQAVVLAVADAKPLPKDWTLMTNDQLRAAGYIADFEKEGQQQMADGPK